MYIKVISPNSNPPKNDRSDVTFYLRQDNWNDHSYQTQYHLFLSSRYTDDGEILSIGDVKILKKGQTKADGLQLTVGEFESLSDDFCSVGQSLDFYERLANINSDLRHYILSSLRDVVIFKEFKSGFEDEEGWKISLMRDIGSDDDIFLLSPIIISREYQKIPSIDLKFQFNTVGLESPIEFDFDSPAYSYKEKLPSRMIVLVGRNGSGKSTLLSKISRIAFSSGSDRKDAVLSRVGSFEPSGLGFPKVVNISYSAFDSFQIPGIYIHEKEQILRDLSKHQGRYIFCGIRDICKELEQSREVISYDDRGRLSEADILRDREEFTHLKSVDRLSVEVKELLEIINKNKKGELLLGAFSILSKESSFKAIYTSVSGGDSTADIVKIFMTLSTGHKFVIHSIVNIVAHTEKRSLILFDEPETHLHPPLLAVLMSEIRYVLGKVDAFSIIATHSPVVVQETLSKHVHIIRRSGESTKVISPDIQTYGESIASITSFVFGLSSDITDFHYEIDKVINNIKLSFIKKSDKEIMNDIEKLFSGKTSVQARAYIMSKLIHGED
ncbi:AAA family ATPase [Aeromonas popoffii]|uniref:AAA family ATPase n=1 Tax=Aeromonas popoffii TaxID=70856 RepID=A0ABS5GTY5_9GAMM|nr:AAA family ATPase [Aeromonas popoffii]MBR7630297.1 AAA family ATPase [Aeromonas popoffii]